MTQALTVELDVPATMRDGTVLRANIYRPVGDGPWPVLLTRTPYGKDFAFAGTGIDPAAAVKRGYILIIQDARGRFESDGEWSPMRAEIEDGADTVEWAASLPGSNGSVGMHGGSYLGFTQWAAAHGGSSALKAIAPVITWSDPFDGLGYRGGALEFGTLVTWSFGVGVDVLAKRYPEDLAARFGAMRAHAAQFDAIAESGFFSLPLNEFSPLESQRAESIFYETVAAEQSPDADLLQRAGVKDWSAAHEVPAFNIGGWYDIFLAGTIANYQAGGTESRLLIGPWAHALSNPVGERNFGFGAQTGAINLEIDLGSLQLDWFDRWCKGIEAPETPPIRIFVMGTNVWRYETEWPLRRARTTPLYLEHGGRLSERPAVNIAADEFIYDPANPVPTLGGATEMPPEFRAGAFDQRRIEEREDVLTYTTEPLAADLEVTGPIEVRLWASSSAPDTDFVARLCDVFPDGRSINLTDGIIRARYRGGGTAQFLEPEQPYEFVIDLWATSNVFLAGHRIRVDITSSSFPRWDRNPNTGHNLGADDQLQKAWQLIHGSAEYPSRILLPVVP